MDHSPVDHTAHLDRKDRVVHQDNVNRGVVTVR